MDNATGPNGIGERLATVLEDRGEVFEALQACHDSIWHAVDPVLLELARLRIAMLLGHDAELVVRTPAAAAAGLDEATIAELRSWPRSDRFDAGTRACLALLEQYLVDVSSITADQTTAVADHLGDDGLTNFVSALLVLEQRQRLDLTWTQLLGAHQ